MSTNSECLFIEVEPGRWYYVLEDMNAPKNSWDWREYATAYGPFPTEDAADRSLRDNHANPGGSSTRPYEPGYQPDEVMQRLIEKAMRPDGHGGLRSQDGRMRMSGPFVFFDF